MSDDNGPSPLLAGIIEAARRFEQERAAFKRTNGDFPPISVVERKWGAIAALVEAARREGVIHPLCRAVAVDGILYFTDCEVFVKRLSSEYVANLTPGMPVDLTPGREGD